MCLVQTSFSTFATFSLQINRLSYSSSLFNRFAKV